MGALLLRSNGKVGEDGRIAIDKMARSCADVGALVRRSVRKGALRWGVFSVEIRKKQGGWAHRYRENGAEVRSNECADAEKCGERCAAVGRFLSRNKGKVGWMGASL